jgi:hypothetical protein
MAKMRASSAHRCAYLRTCCATLRPPYRARVAIGPTYRADMWAALDRDPTLSAAALARRTYGSFATAWHTRRDYSLLLEAESITTTLFARWRVKNS